MSSERVYTPEDRGRQVRAGGPWLHLVSGEERLCPGETLVLKGALIAAEGKLEKAEQRVAELEATDRQMREVLRDVRDANFKSMVEEIKALAVRAEAAEALLAKADAALRDSERELSSWLRRWGGECSVRDRARAVLAEITTASKEPRTGDDQALREAAHILRQVALDRDPRESALSSVPVEARAEAESWLAQWEPAASKETM